MLFLRLSELLFYYILVSRYDWVPPSVVDLGYKSITTHMYESLFPPLNKNKKS